MMNLFCTNLLSKVVVALLITALLIGGSGQPVAFAQAGAPGQPSTLGLDDWQFVIGWAFFFDVENGSVEAGTRYIITVDIFKDGYRMERLQHTIAATCEPHGAVSVTDNAAVFEGGHFTCTPTRKGDVQSLVKEMLKRSNYRNYLNLQTIKFGSYENPWAAANVDLSEIQPRNTGYSTVAAHPDVTLNLVNQGGTTSNFRLALRVVGADLLASSDPNHLGWGIGVGNNRFWVGQNVENFLSFWGNQLNQLPQYFYFLPRAEEFPNTADRFFLHNGIQRSAAPTTTEFGGPSPTTNLKVTIGCDANGKNCVHMTLHTLLLDPTCMGG